MYGLRHLFLTPRRIETRRQYIRPQRNSDKQIREHVDERTGRSHRCQRLAAGKPAHHDNIYRIEHQLQNTRQHERQREGNQFVHNRSVAHIDLVFILFCRCLFHLCHLSCSVSYLFQPLPVLSFLKSS